MPPVIAKLAREILRDPLTIQIGRRSAPAVGITQAAYPVAEHLKTPLLAPPAAAHGDALGAGVHAHEASGPASGAASPRTASR